MLDRFALPFFTRPHRAVAAACIRFGMTANTLTIIGWLVGMTALPLIAWGQFEAALAVILINRFLDGVDGTMARTLGPTDRGAFLDIACDFLFYAAVPLGFAFFAAITNALPAAVLLASFVGSGSTFLAYAAVSAKRGDVSPVYPNKAIYYLGGLTEGTETIIVFCLMCLLPQHFAVIAYVFAAACAVTTATRLIVGAHLLK